LKQLGRPANRLKHKSAPLRLRGRALVFQRNSRPAGEKFESLGKGDALVFLNKADDIAVFVTGPTLVALAPWIDVEGGPVVVVKGTEPLERAARRAQGHVAADDLNDVVGLFHLSDQRVVRRGPPLCRSPK